MIDENQIVENWNKLIGVIENGFDGERKDNLLNLYNTLQDRIIVAPASSKKYFHSAFPGGYVYHVLNVIRIATKLSDFAENVVGLRKNYTDEELLFVAMNHDLGKIGDEKHDNYVEANEDWRIRRGEVYTMNPDINFMMLPDRSLYILQAFNVKMTQKEWIAIRVHDGMYVESNQPYLNNYNPDNQLKFNLPLVVHQADMLAARYEYEEYLDEKAKNAPQHIVNKETKKKKTGPKTSTEAMKSVIEDKDVSGLGISKAFDELFGGTD